MGFEVAHEKRRPLARFPRHVGNEVGAVDQQDGGTLGRGAQRHAAADALGGPGHHHHLVAKAPGECHAATATGASLGANFS